jgi:hypothetical protein
MQLVLSPRAVATTLALAAVTCGLVSVGVSPAHTAAARAVAAAPQRTVTASRITRPKGTLAPGSKVSSAALGQRVFTDNSHGFALADVGGAQYSAATSDGGKNWSTDGPALHLDAAQAPLAVVNIGVASRKTVFAYGGGQVIDTTSDGGKNWYRALFNGLVMAVVRNPQGHLVAFVDGSTSSGGSKGVTWQYVSKNGGRSWRYDTTVGGS